MNCCSLPFHTLVYSQIDPGMIVGSFAVQGVFASKRLQFLTLGFSSVTGFHASCALGCRVWRSFRPSGIMQLYLRVFVLFIAAFGFSRAQPLRKGLPVRLT